MPHEWVLDCSTPEEEAAGFAAALARLGATIETGEPADVEPTLGLLVDGPLPAKGISCVDSDTRPMLLIAFARASGRLQDPAAQREGDYSPDPKATRFPEFVPPEQSKPASKATALPKTTLTSLVTDC